MASEGNKPSGIVAFENAGRVKGTDGVDVDTYGQLGRALVVATDFLSGVEGVVVFASGGVLDEARDADTNKCVGLMGEPEGPGCWVWEGSCRVECVGGSSISGPELEAVFDGCWRIAHPEEVYLWVGGRSPFSEGCS